MLVSIVIRTLNEERFLGDLLKQITKQRKDNFSVEVVVVDSGSEDDTINIAKSFNTKITHIQKNDFTFGRSLNIGSSVAQGEILIYVSGHCIPRDENWIINLISPIREGIAGYTYGGQLGVEQTKFSEKQIFRKYYPEKSEESQKGYFCNNANSALKKEIWSNFKFNENLTGLEDMELAKRFTEEGGKILYVSEASVFHIHNESYTQIRRRFEREAIALKFIMPEINVTLSDMVRYIISSIIYDIKTAVIEKIIFKEVISIFKYRISQYYGTYVGNRSLRELSREKKEKFFYPSNKI